MKSVQYQNKKDVFADWVYEEIIPTNTNVYWPQITYEWNSCEPIHIVFEKNQHSFKWPWDSPVYLKWPFTNIDFTSGTPTLPNGDKWDFKNWYKTALHCSLQNQVRDGYVPPSFWEWRLQTRPQGNATCDMDVLLKKNGKWIGVEATEIWYVTENQSNYNLDCYQHISNLIHKRKAFNFKALLAQNIFMESINGEHYFVLHQIDKDRGILIDNQVIVIPLNCDTLRIVQNKSFNRDDVKNYLGPHIEFMPLSKFLS